MPISATGSNSCGPNGWANRRSRKQTGFTLIEILLVIAIMAVVTAMIAPSYFSVSTPSLEQQGRRLAQLLRLAVEETAMDGRPVRWLARAHGYSFETINAEGVWLELHDNPFERFSLPAGMTIMDVQPVTDAGQSANREEDPVIARLTLMPEGIVEPARIVLADSEKKQLTILLRPGPAGIAVDDGQKQ